MSDYQVRIKDSMISGVINGVINGIIAFYLFGNVSSVALSQDAISSHELSVWGQAVSLTFGLGIILTLITAKLFCKQMKNQFPSHSQQFSQPVFPNLLRLALSNAVVLFGWFVTLAVIWTRAFGEIRVSTVTAAILVGLFALVVTLVVEVRTKKQIIFRPTSIFADN